MSLLPYVFGYDDWPVYRRSLCPRRFLDQNFGLALTPDDVISPLLGSDDFRQLTRAAQNSNIKCDKDKFQVNIDVQHFAPEEISVKTTDGDLIIEGKHEEKRDQHGYISRQFTRRYALPEGCQTENIQSRLSSDGVLTITAPRQPLALKGERTVPIQYTGPVRKEIKESEHSEPPTRTDG